MMCAEDAVFIYQRLSSQGIPVWLTGGWGIDALLQAQTRPHKDVDIILLLDDVVRMQQVLARAGYHLKELWSENSWAPDRSGVDAPTAFVLEDSEDRQIDAHVMRMDDQGNGIPAWNNEEGLIFRAEDLAGEGIIAGVAVRCITPGMQAICHTGYRMPDFQTHDMKLLHQRFGFGHLRGSHDPDGR